MKPNAKVVCKTTGGYIFGRNFFFYKKINIKSQFSQNHYFKLIDL